MSDSILNVFLALIRAGLWEKDIQLLSFGEIDYPAVITLANEQSVVGLVSAGIEHVTDLQVPKEYVLQVVGQTLQIEQSNNAMNKFIGVLIDKMRGAEIYTLLVKGQGIAQCYERPLWRSCGDVDLLLSDDNYFKAKIFLSQIATSIDSKSEMYGVKYINCSPEIPIQPPKKDSNFINNINFFFIFSLLSLLI